MGDSFVGRNLLEIQAEAVGSDPDLSAKQKVGYLSEIERSRMDWGYCAMQNMKLAAIITIGAAIVYALYQ